MAGSTGFHLDVGDGHQIWLQPWGNPAGFPVLFLHGGPGSGCNPGQSALFDAARHRVIFMDQRGAGRSLPHRGREANTTAHLLADIEKVRRHFGIERWLVAGGSWGATLALAYAQAHPDRVAGLVLRSVFLGTRAELDWAFHQAPSRFHPGLYADFRARFPGLPGGKVIDACFGAVLNPDQAVHGPAAWAFHHLERALSELAPALTRLPPTDPDGPLPATAFMEAHYFSQGCFLPEGALLANCGRLAAIAGIIVQARHDLLCPPSTTASLAAAWGNAEIRMVESAGHALSHPEVARAFAGAVAELAASRFGA